MVFCRLGRRRFSKITGAITSNCTTRQPIERLEFDWKFVQDDISVSRRHVLRGVHGDYATTKLVSCLQGAFYLVVVNNILNSPQFRQWQGFTLSEHNRQQILVPPGFGNGHVVLTETAMFHYKQTTEYDRSSQFTLLWNDPMLDIWWPIANPITSPRDSGIQV